MGAQPPDCIEGPAAMDAPPVPDLMLALSRELSRLAAETESFHDLIAGDGRDAAFIRKAQSIDHATQVLAELAGFCAAVAADAPPAMRLPAGPAFAMLRLGELRERLSPGAAKPPRQPGDGAVELF